MGQYMIGTGVTITETFLLDGVPTDPTGVTLYIRDPQDVLTSYVFGVDIELTNPAVGTYQLSFTPTLVGHYNYRVEGTGTVVAVCEGDFDILPSPTLDIDPAGVELGPCTTWVDAADVAACCNVEVGSDFSTFEFAATQASQFLFELSGRRFSGSCKRTVRPCGNQFCGFQVLSRGHIIWPEGGNDGWGWGGYRWRYPSFAGCGCQPLDRILLSGYPVTSIVNVKIDGVMISDDTYRLDERRLLTRVRDPADPDVMLMWPSCQMFDLPDTEVGTFSVTYIHGADPPALGEAAAAELACQFYKSCLGADLDCVLPEGTTRATRQGLTIDKTATLEWFFSRQNGGWSTGLRLVDAFLSAYNSAGLTRRPAVWSPSGPQYARPAG